MATLFDWLKKPTPTPKSSVSYGSSMPIKFVSDSPDALDNVTVMTAVNIMASTIAQLPWSVVEEDAESFKPFENQINSVLKKPNSDMTPYELKYRIVHDLMVHGNVYLLKVMTSAGRVTELLPLEPELMEPTRSLSGVPSYYYNKQTTYTQSQIIHIRDIITDEVEGISRVKKAKKLIGQMDSLDRAMTSSFDNSLNISSIISTENDMEPEQRTELSEDLNKKFNSKNGTERGGFVILSGAGKMSFDQLKPQSVADAETQSLTKLEIARVAAVFRIPVAFFEVAESKYSNLSQKNTSFYRDSIQPILKNISQKMAVGLLSGSNNLTIGFNASDLIKGDLVSTTKVAQDSYTSGLLTLNEARNLISYESVEEGDKFIESPKAPEPNTHNEYETDDPNGPREAGND